MAGEYGSAVNLPPGFRFGPTDKELILHFLLPKARHMLCYPDIIPDLGYSMPDPWQLHGKALWSENQYYFFRRVKVDDDDEEEKMMMMSSSNGMWKEVVDDDMGEEEGMIFSGNRVIGLKKLLVFCSDLEQAPHHETSTTNWFMQHYYLHHSSTSFNTPAAAAAGKFIGGGGGSSSHDHDDHQYSLGYCKWTLCRVEERKGRLHQSLSYNDEEDNRSQLSCLDEMYLEFDDDFDVTFPN